MGQYKVPAKVKLIIGLLGADLEILKTARARLLEKFGAEEEVLEPIPFTWTNYYAREVGDTPLRSFVSYEGMIDRQEMVEIKRFTNELEIELSRDGLRPVNLDPGYLTMGQFFLATTKDQRQRVYIRDGIFVEPTLFFQDGKFQPFDWTYPDYRSQEYHAYLLAAREKLAYQMRHEGVPFSQGKPKRKARMESPGLPPAKPRGGDPEGDDSPEGN